MSKVAADLSVVTSVGLDLAKHVFQVHAVDAGGKVIVAKALRRRDLLPFFASLITVPVYQIDHRRAPCAKAEMPTQRRQLWEREGRVPRIYPSNLPPYPAKNATIAAPKSGLVTQLMWLPGISA